MKGHWWSCVLGLLCMPAEVILSSWTVSQHPSSTSIVRVNSSIEITCSTSFSGLHGVYLHRSFHSNKDIVFLLLENGHATKSTTVPEFENRIQFRRKQLDKGFGFTFQLRLLMSEDTDWYYCSWLYVTLEKAEEKILSTNGSIIIVRERDPHEQCQDHIVDNIFIALSITALCIILFLITGVIIVKCKQFKKNFRPARAVKPSRPNRPQHVCPQREPQGVHHCPYLITSSSDTLDFRGIL